MRIRNGIAVLSLIALSALTACTNAPSAVQITTSAQTTKESEKSLESQTQSQAETPVVIDITVEESSVVPEKSEEEPQPVSSSEIVETTSEVAETTAKATEPLEPTQPKEPDAAYDIVNAQYAANLSNTQVWYQTIKDAKKLPCISFTTQDSVPVVTKSYQYAVIDVFNCDPQFELSTNGQVKVRGNSSAEGDEKPYRIKFDSKHSMLGLHDNRAYKSWVLLRTYWNVAPDYTAFKLAETIFQDEYFASDGTFVNVFVNGEYKGVYLLCEQNSSGKDRFDVKEPKAAEAGSEIGYVIEMDNYDDKEHPVFAIYSSQLSLTDMNGETRNIESNRYSVKSDITTEEQQEFITKYMRGVFTIMYEASVNNNPMMFDADYNVVSASGVYSTAYQAVEAVIDTKSLANMLILEELVHDYDVGEGSFFMAIDFSENSGYRKLTFCGPWDFSWCYEGDTNGKYYASTWQKMMDWGDNSNTWFIMAMRIPEFQQLVKQRWAVVSDALVDTTRRIDAYVDTLAPDTDYISGGIICAHRIQDYVRGRIDWLNSVWK